MAASPNDQPAVHYDAVTRAWRYLMGESFHYGYFESLETSLDEATRALTERMAEAGKIGEGQRVLDVGCGIGGPAEWLVNERGAQVDGISTSEVGIAEANERAVSRGFSESARFHVRDGMDNGFEAASFDRVWVMESSHLMPDKKAMIRDSARVLKAGGRFVLCDIIVHRNLPIAEVLERASTFDLLRRVFGRAKMETLEAYAGWLEEAGLAPDLVEDVSAQAAPTFSRWKTNADSYRDEVSGLIGEEGWAEFRQACVELESLWEDGTLGYGLIAADQGS
jgi:27-O-demethylrifamycin SV methyltransferase